MQQQCSYIKQLQEIPPHHFTMCFQIASITKNFAVVSSLIEQLLYSFFIQSSMCYHILIAQSLHKYICTKVKRFLSQAVRGLLALPWFVILFRTLAIKWLI